MCCCCWPIEVEGDPNAPLSIATTRRSRGGRYSFPWIGPFYPWYVPYNAECLSKEVLRSIFWVFGTTRPGIEPWSPGATGQHYPLDQWDQSLGIIHYIRIKISRAYYVWKSGEVFVVRRLTYWTMTSYLTGWNLDRTFTIIFRLMPSNSTITFGSWISHTRPNNSKF